MAATAAQIAQLRRMIAEPLTTTYSDATLTTYIEARAVADSRGVLPWEWDFSTTPPTATANTAWVTTYDLNAAAAELWEEKAAAVACDYATNADGANLQRNQVYDQYMRIASRYRSKACLGVAHFASVERVRSETGEVVEQTPIIDRIESDEVFND
jgi:ribosomal protein S26